MAHKQCLLFFNSMNTFFIFLLKLNSNYIDIPQASQGV